MHLFVGSTNPVKINAIKSAVSQMWADATIEGIEVPSGISDQPLSDEETRTGATNRATAALEVGRQRHSLTETDEALGIGLEGGVFKKGNELWSTVWVVVVDKDGNLAESNGARFKVPDPIARPILAGEEMGPVVGRLLGNGDIKRQQGAIGVVTQGFVDRTEEYSGIAKLALGLWYGRNWHLDLK